MAGAAKLKVYRTAIGFHDAYVAAPSKKAALAAWGSAKDLFARGAAELVTDEALTVEPLAAPGTIIKRLRGTPEEQLAALPPNRPDRNTDDAGPPTAAAPKPKPKPRPSRAALDEAERAIEEAEERQAREQADLVRREQELARERSTMLERHARTLRPIEAAREEAAAAYNRAISAWRAD